MAQEWWEVTAPNTTFEAPTAVGQCPVCKTTLVCPGGNCPPHVCKSPQSSSAQNSGSSGVFIPTTEQQIQMMLVQGFVTWLFTPTNTAPDPAEEAARLQEIQRQQELLAQQEALRQQQENIAFQQLLNSTKYLNSGTSQAGTLSLGGGELEQMSLDAAAQFAPEVTETLSTTTDGGTPFFGSNMSREELMTILSPETNPVIIDVMTADALMVANLKEPDMPVETEVIQDQQENGAPIEEEPVKFTPQQCYEMQAKLDKYEIDLDRFYEWNKFTRSELEEWQKKNDEAFWTAIYDVCGIAFDKLFEYMVEQKKVLEQMQDFIRSAQFQSAKTMTPAEMEKALVILEGRAQLIDAFILDGKRVEDFKKTAGETQALTAYIKNVGQAVMREFTPYDKDIKELYDALQTHGFYGDSPILSAAEGLSGPAIEAIINWGYGEGTAAAAKKIGYVGLLQTGLTLAYDGYAIYSSYQNIITNRGADGQHTKAVLNIKNNMNVLRSNLSHCSQ